MGKPKKGATFRLLPGICDVVSVLEVTNCDLKSKGTRAVDSEGKAGDLDFSGEWRVTSTNDRE